MARNREFLLIPDSIVHVYNRGVDRRQLFRGRKDYDKFMDLIMLAEERVALKLLCYTLMPNHFHFVLYQQEPHAISRFMYDVCRPFALSINKRQERSGPLFDSRYDATVIYDPAGFLRVSRYVHVNPVRAGLSKTMEEWRYSSCKAYVEACGHTLVCRELLWGLVGGPEKYRTFLENFDPADPQAAEEFLCPNADRIWDRARDYLGKKDVPGRKVGPRVRR